MTKVYIVVSLAIFSVQLILRIRKHIHRRNVDYLGKKLSKGELDSEFYTRFNQLVAKVGEVDDDVLLIKLEIAKLKGRENE